ncbi:porin [Thalassobius sp. Cn5-15]|jgi:outer membrane protein OmpU|uniref:porin n=1 Tax=Thalassobius sp. Cn5-15 TaxID=2917763 RepID=UPI001EF229C3|nr:porin [Thalassobius sp. Cn5-15]MCG7494081.1 porin [Thalassobius sp. Cn5-15]
MKKILFATTALVATAGVAAAEISFSGSANFGATYDGDNTAIENEIDFNIEGTGETDGGVSFGASLDIDGGFDTEEATQDSQAEVSSPEVFVSVAGLTVTVGSSDAANDNEGLSDIGFDGLGVDDVAEISGNGSTSVLVEYSLGDIAVSASVETGSVAGDDWALGATGSFGDISFAAGYGEADKEDEYNLYVGYSMGAIAVGVQYSETDDNTGYGLQASYTQGDLTVTGLFASNDNDDAYGIGASYSLGGGAAVAGGIAEVADETVAELGMTFSF